MRLGKLAGGVINLTFRVSFILALCGLVYYDQEARKPKTQNNPLERLVPTHILRPGIDFNFEGIFGTDASQTAREWFAPVRAAFGECGAPVCIVNFSHGGVLGVFEEAGRTIFENPDTLLIINGYCASGCAVAADLARGRACITKRAAFYFHQGYEPAITTVNGQKVRVRRNFFNQPQSAEIDKWVREHGSYPRDGVTKMPFSEAKKFWPVCFVGDAPLPRPKP